MFEISHADLSSEEGGFHALPVFRPAYLPVPSLLSVTGYLP
jgi:hypothetical protein